MTSPDHRHRIDYLEFADPDDYALAAWSQA